MRVIVIGSGSPPRPSFDKRFDKAAVVRSHQDGSRCQPARAPRCPMTPGKEGDLLAKIDIMLSMLGGPTDKIGKVENQLAEMRGEMIGRFEEQSRLLIKLVPQPLAAIAGR